MLPSSFCSSTLAPAIVYAISVLCDMAIMAGSQRTEKTNPIYIYNCAAPTTSTTHRTVNLVASYAVAMNDKHCDSMDEGEKYIALAQHTENHSYPHLQ